MYEDDLALERISSAYITLWADPIHKDKGAVLFAEAQGACREAYLAPSKTYSFSKKEVSDLYI